MLLGKAVFVRMALIVVVFSGWAKAAAVSLVKDGNPASVIIMSKNPTIAAHLAARELQYHLKEITGIELPIRTPDQAVEGVRILVGESAATHEFGLKSEGFQSQEYLIQIKDFCT